ncbi:hypothetical protein L208DRAFT_945656 [Tricholoma matsutake]|nr:hypothetical protein L208DRAFT_945656 [Tricholoma matsutake 945]
MFINMRICRKHDVFRGVSTPGVGWSRWPSLVVVISALHATFISIPYPRSVTYCVNPYISIYHCGAYDCLMAYFVVRGSK